MEKKRNESVLMTKNDLPRNGGILKRNSVPLSNAYNNRVDKSQLYHSSSVGNKTQLRVQNNLLNRDLMGESGRYGNIFVQSIIAYLGTVQLYASAKEIPQKSVAAMQSCIERLRKEQHIHQRVVIKVKQSGVKLYNADSDVIAVYEADEIGFASSCPNDERFFCIVTCYENNRIKCHEFMIDTNITSHSAHQDIAKRFGISCSMDTDSNQCIEFPTSPRILLSMIESLFISREHQGSLNNIIRGPSNSSNTSVSTADSGLGISYGEKIPLNLHRKMQIQEMNFSKKGKKGIKGNKSANSFFTRHTGAKRSSSRRDKTNLKNILSKSSESIPHSDTGSLSCASSNESIASLPSCVNGNFTAPPSNMGKEILNSGRVPLWAVSFDRLLEDVEGLKYLTEFLRKEFSEENILFWIECEKLKKIPVSQPNELQEISTSIYERFLSSNAPSPINIDSKGQRMADESRNNPPHPEMYQYQQLQIYKLMKLDSYSRFLKSSLYRQCIVNEMEGRPLPLDEPPDNVSVKSSTHSEDNSDYGSTKRRFNIFQSSNKSRKSNDSFKMHESVNTEPHDLPTNIPTEADMSKICRLLLWDGTTTVMYAAGQTTIREALGLLCERRGVGLSAVDVFYVGEDRPLSLDQDIAVLAGQEVLVEKRTLFRLDMLPIRRSVGIKSKSSKIVLDVLKPVVEKYGLQLDKLQAKIAGEDGLLDMNQSVNILDNLRVAVDLLPEVKQTDSGTLKDKRRKSKDKIKALTTRNSPKKVGNGSPNILTKHDKNDFLKIMSATQSGKLDDQRGLISEMNLELPDFLKVTVDNDDSKSSNSQSSDVSITQSDSSTEIKETMLCDKIIHNNNNNNDCSVQKHRNSIHHNTSLLETQVEETQKQYSNVPLNFNNYDGKDHHLMNVREMNVLQTNNKYNQEGLHRNEQFNNDGKSKIFKHSNSVPHYISHWNSRTQTFQRSVSCNETAQPICKPISEVPSMGYPDITEESESITKRTVKSILV